MKNIVKKHEIGLLFKDQSFIKAVSSGTYRFNAWSGRELICADMRLKFAPQGMGIALFKHDELLMEKLNIVNVKDHEIALHYVDGNFADVLGSGVHAYFNEYYAHTFTMVDTNMPVIADEIDPSIFSKVYFLTLGKTYVSSFSVPSGHVGILLKNGEYIKSLDTGNHYFWKGQHTVEVKSVDMRAQIIEIAGQELLSKDKVTLRMNFVCQYNVTDAIKAVTEFDNYQVQLYSALQLALREYVSTKNLDELLAEKHEMGKIIVALLQDRQSFFGAEFLEAGVKDIILPGDIRDILNTVLVAEKRALANVITRREETASTRSLLNTAKLMEENKTLYKLKELEYMERICDKVGNISLSTGAGVIEQLGTLLGK